MSFGVRLKQIRNKRGMTQIALAKKIGVKQCLLSWYESDKVQPTIDRIEWLCTALNVSATELLGF